MIEPEKEAPTRRSTGGTESALEFRGVRKNYGSQRALDNLTLSIPGGSVFALLGPNGAGKSTAVKVAMGLLRPDEGSTAILGRNVLDDPSWTKKHVGYVPELHFMYRWMRVDEVLRFASGFYPSWNAALCRNLLERFELPPRKKVRHLSKGMVVKLSLIISLTHEPEVMVLDEPTSGLDPLIREELLDGVLRTLCDRTRTVLFASHTLQDVQRLADRVGILCNGELLVDRPIDELLQTTKTVRATLTDGCLPQHVPVGTIHDSVERREWCVTLSDYSAGKLDELRLQNPVEHVEVESMNLEDVFKAYVRGRRAIA